MADVLVVGEKIAAVGPALEAPRGARIVDATGKYVIPGGIDTRECELSFAVACGVPHLLMTPAPIQTPVSKKRCVGPSRGAADSTRVGRLPVAVYGHGGH